LDPGDSYHNQINLEGTARKSKQYNELRRPDVNLCEPRHLGRGKSGAGG
jgi:hypothetical protein